MLQVQPEPQGPLDEGQFGVLTNVHPGSTAFFAPRRKRQPRVLKGEVWQRAQEQLPRGSRVLLMPFGFHRTMDTLPSEDARVGGFRSALACFRLSVSCPFSYWGSIAWPTDASVHASLCPLLFWIFIS